MSRSPSSSASPAPPLELTASPTIDESRLPQGQCRYILLLPEVKGQRCACVHFTHHRGMPSATCDCGHLACFHLKEAEPPSDHKKELEVLRRKVEMMEDQMSRNGEEGLVEVRTRVIDLEEVVDKRSEEMEERIKNSYGNLTRSWKSITEVERRLREVEQRLEHHDEHFAGVDNELQRLGERQLELVEEDIRLELRIDALEESSVEPSTPTRERRPERRPTTDSSAQNLPLDSTLTPRRRRSSASRPQSLLSNAEALTPHMATTSMPFRGLSAPAASGIWTVHVSLLPSASIGMPFERNTNAYQRCLSRGLHQTVAIQGTDSKSFVQAVSTAFESLLRGRPWIPLQAQLCDAERLSGLPMLRPFDVSLADSLYDFDFLRRHCAVCDAAGKMDSLYIAMRNDKLSWHALRSAPIFMPGLEASWAHDALLDPNDPDDAAAIDEDSLPAAGEVVPFATLKRGASEISRSSSFGAAAVAPASSSSSTSSSSSSSLSSASVQVTAAEGEAAVRVKRSCPLPNAIVEMRRRRVETA